MTYTEWKKVALQNQKRKKSEGKMLHHCNLICVSPKHGMHGSSRCSKILYIHNCWNLFFVPEPLWNSDNQKWSNFKIDFFHRSITSPFAVKYFCYRLLLISQRKIWVFKTPVKSSNLGNQAPLFAELHLLQATQICTIQNGNQ